MLGPHRSIRWSFQIGVPPYRAGLLAALDAGIRFMLAWMDQHRADLLVVLSELRGAGAAYGIA